MSLKRRYHTGLSSKFISALVLLHSPLEKVIVIIENRITLFYSVWQLEKYKYMNVFIIYFPPVFQFYDNYKFKESKTTT